MDNDRKHTSKLTKDFLSNYRVNWWPTPPQSPDLNPIELVWHALTTYVRKNAPKTCYSTNTTLQFIQTIKQFWRTLTPTVCRKYIEHLPRVMPHVIINDGASTAF
jgi:transposase